MKQLYNIFARRIKNFKQKTGRNVDITIKLGDLDESEFYTIYLECDGNFCSDTCISDDIEERCDKLFEELIIRVKESERGRPRFTIGEIRMEDFTPVLAREPIEVRPRPCSIGEF